MKNRIVLLRTVTVLATLSMIAGGVIAGVALAPSTTNTVPSGTETVAVIAPVSLGSAPPEQVLKGGEDELRVSEPVAEREVRRPASNPDVIDPSLTEIFDELADAADPTFILMTLDGEADGEDTGVTDDPCAPRDRESDAGCPDGLHSTVLSLTGLRAFSAGVQAFPPTQAEFREHGNPVGGPLWCDGLSAGENQVPLGILASAPGSFTLRYWPSEHPDRAMTVSDIVTSDADRSAFEASVEAATNWDEVAPVRHCRVLDGIEPNTAYTVSVNGVDIYDRISPSAMTWFRSDGAPVHPGAKIVPLGDSLVFVSALHPPTESVEIRATVSTPEATNSCDTTAWERMLPVVSDQSHTANRDDIAAMNAPADFTKRHSIIFTVPEGSTILVCARWYPAEGATSWALEQPSFESSALLNSPDRILPSLELTQVHPYARDLQSVSFTAASAEGLVCGNAVWSTDRSLPSTLCNAVGGSGGTSVTDHGHITLRGASGDIVVRITSEFGDGRTLESGILIPSLDPGCTGECSLPPDAWYEVALGNVDQPYGLCGSSFGDCTPPTRRISAGTVQFKVTWDQGASNGLSDWTVSPTLDLPRDYIAPDEPQFDLNQVWTFDEPTFRTLYGTSSPNPFLTARFQLAADRPVDYTLRLSQSTPGVAALGCDSSALPLERSGHADAPIILEFPGACLGNHYNAELLLIDESGSRVQWDTYGFPHFWRSAGAVHVPMVDVEMHYDIQANGVGHSTISDLEFSLGRNEVAVADRRSGQCTEDGVFESHGMQVVPLGETVRVYFTIRMVPVDRWTPESCSAYGEYANLRVVEATLPLTQLFDPVGVTITSAGDPSVSIVLHGYRPRP